MIVSRKCLEIASDGGSIGSPDRGGQDWRPRRRGIDVAVTSGLGAEPAPPEPRSRPPDQSAPDAAQS